MSNRGLRLRLGAGLVAAGLCAFGVRGMQAQGSQQAAPPCPAGPPDRRSDSQELHLALDRPRQHGRPYRRYRGGRKQSLDVLRRVRDRRHLEDDQQRHDLHAALRRAAGHLDWRHRGRPVESRRHLRRHRRAEQPPELVVRRRRLQVHGRRQDLEVHRAQRDAEHRRGSSSIRRIRTSSTSRRSGTSSDRTPSAVSTRRPTAARPGRTRSSSTTTRASPTS